MYWLRNGFKIKQKNFIINGVKNKDIKTTVYLY